MKNILKYYHLLTHHLLLLLTKSIISWLQMTISIHLVKIWIYILLNFIFHPKIMSFVTMVACELSNMTSGILVAYVVYYKN